MVEIDIAAPARVDDAAIVDRAAVEIDRAAGSGQHRSAIVQVAVEVDLAAMRSLNQAAVGNTVVEFNIAVVRGPDGRVIVHPATIEVDLAAAAHRKDGAAIGIVHAVEERDRGAVLGLDEAAVVDVLAETEVGVVRGLDQAAVVQLDIDPARRAAAGDEQAAVIVEHLVGVGDDIDLMRPQHAVIDKRAADRADRQRAVGGLDGTLIQKIAGDIAYRNIATGRKDLDVSRRARPGRIAFKRKVAEFEAGWAGYAGDTLDHYIAVGAQHRYAVVFRKQEIAANIADREIPAYSGNFGRGKSARSVRDDRKAAGHVAEYHLASGGDQSAGGGRRIDI